MARFILTAAETREAEERAIAGGTPVAQLMERAGTGVAEAAWRFAGPLPALVLCGPGNNGGDGYVAARLLRDRGIGVRVASLGDPKPGAAAAAARAWDGPIEPLAAAAPAPLLIDALFGTGLTRGLEPGVAARLETLAEAARVRVAVDLPSGVETDSGACFGPGPAFDLTVTFASLKPAHRLFPAAARCGRVVVVDIGVPVQSALTALAPALPPAPGWQDHKFTRGMVAAIGGDMPGASALAATAAAHAGAGYVLLLEHAPAEGLPQAIVRRSRTGLAAALADPRIAALVVGPGLGRGPDAGWALDLVLASGRPLVIDGDALRLLDGRRAAAAILTPHEGEFAALFPELRQPSKIERACAAAAAAGMVIVYKGADTVIAAPDGQAAIAPAASPWLSTAGSGDVLAGAIAAMLARGLDPFAAAQAGVWLHAQAARALGAGFVADALARGLSAALAGERR